MPAENATALVLRTINFSETSLIVTLFTREHGKLGALAKGAKRLKNPFDSALDLLTLCRIVFLRKSSGALDLVTEAKLIRRFRPPGKELACLYAAYYVAELLDGLTDHYDPHPELFDLADTVLSALAAGEPVGRWILRFELVALRHVGHLPSLEICAECGKEVRPSGRVAFGLLDGGVLCHACRRGKRQVVSATPGALRVMAQLADPASRTWHRLELDRRTSGEIRGMANRYLANLLGRRPRMHEYLGVFV